MTCRHRSFRALVLLVGLVLPACGDGSDVVQPAWQPPAAAAAAGGAPTGADAAALEVYRRDLLLQEADRRFGSRQIKTSDAVASLAALEDDEAFVASFAPRNDEEKELVTVLARTIAERQLLLGDLPPEAGNAEDEGHEAPAAIGALREAQRLLRWIEGDPSVPCQVFVRRVDAKGEVLSETPYSWPPPAPLAPAAGEGEPGAAAPESAEAGADAPPPAEKETETEGEEAEAPAPKEPPPPPKAEPTVREKMAAWAQEVTAKEQGLRGKTLSPGVCSTVSSLLSIANAAPDYLPRDGWGLERFPLASKTPFAYNRPYLELRKLLSAERVAAWKAEAGEQLLVDENTVRERARRAKEFEDQLAATRAEGDAILAELDRIVDQVDRWENVAAVLSGRIQEEQIRLEEDVRGEAAPLAEPTEAAEAPRSPRLRVLEAQEATVSMDVGLIYHTVLRARERLGILDAIRVLEEREAHLAASRYRDYAAELAKIRSERSLRRLQVGRQKLVSIQEVLENDDPKAGSAQAHGLAATRALIELNDIVQTLVDRRRRLNDVATTQGASKRGADDAEPEAPTPDASEDSVVEGPALHLVTKDIENQTWALETIANARADLEDPALQTVFDADLVARHYAVAARQARFLAGGLVEIGDASALKERFDTTAALAAAEIEAAAYLGRSRLQPEFDGMLRGYRYAVDDLSNEKRRFEDLLRATEAYRQALLHQGARSLSIRVWADVKTKDVFRAIEDSAQGVRHAVSWLSGDAEPNVVDWGSRAWRQLLGFLALVAVTVGVVFVGRRRIDRWLTARAARIPELRWAGASVRDERRAAQEREKMEVEAKKSAEEALTAGDGKRETAS